jgi:hypothetical protein
MALHRDIYWVGKQWAVTGNGVQACDQKQKSQFDIDPTRLWDGDVVERLRTNKWLNVEDLEKALSIARQRFSEPSGTPVRPASETIAAAPPVAPIEPLQKSPEPVAKPEPSKPAKLDPIKPPPAAPAVLRTSDVTKPDPELPKPAAPGFQMLFSGAAKFIRPWRVRMKK